jgi:hypothetical protein
MPQFSQGYDRLVYIGSDKEFISHTGAYQLRSINWPSQDVTTILDIVPDQPDDSADFGGLYGFHNIFEHSGFLHNSSKYFVLSSEFKGRERIYLVDLHTKEVRTIILPCDVGRTGHYTLMARDANLLVFRYAQVYAVPHIYCVRFVGTEVDTIEGLMEPSNMDILLIEKAELGSSEFCS